MAMKAGERLFCDTNVLLSAVDQRRPLHRHALHVFNTLPNRGVELCVSGQVLREFLVVSTRPAEANGLGMEPAAAVENVAAFVSRSTLLDETSDVSTRLARIVSTSGCSGKQIHDANIAATLLAHGLTQLVTSDPDDMRRFDGVEVVPLGGVLG